MKRMKQLLTGCTVLALLLACAVSASAMEVPTETIVRNLDGVQEYIKVYTVSPETDAADLIEPPFDYNGYTYAYTGIVKVENAYSDTKTHTETVTVETAKKDLNVILEALEPSMEYDDGTWHGVLNLDHTTIQTEAAGHEVRSYTITEVKQIDNLNSNDMSFVPSTTVKDGVTIQLKNVDWQVQSTDLVDDVLVPASYVAVATYSGTGWYSAVTGYVSTAEYVGTVTSEGIGSITYTLTYTGTPIAPVEPEPTPTPVPTPTQEVEPERAPTITKTTEPEDSGERATRGFNWLWMRRNSLIVSDRKYLNYYPLAQAKAWLEGHDKVTPNDLLILGGNMSTVTGEKKCSRCGGIMFYDFDCSTTEEYRFCYRCGFTQKWFLLRHEDGTVKTGEDGGWLGDYAESSGYGVAHYITKDRGSETWAAFDAPLTPEKRAEYEAILERDNIDTSQCYIVVFDPVQKKFTTIFGTCPEDYLGD